MSVFPPSPAPAWAHGCRIYWFISHHKLQMTNDKGKQIMDFAAGIMMYSHSYRVTWQAHQKRSLHGQTWRHTAPQGLQHWRLLRCVSSMGDEGTGSRSTCILCVMPCMLWHRHCITCKRTSVGLVLLGCVKTCGTLTVISCEQISPMLPSTVSLQPTTWVRFIWQTALTQMSDWMMSHWFHRLDSSTDNWLVWLTDW
jgi:hypothetical protein